MRTSVLTTALLAIVPTINGLPHASNGCNAALPDGVKPNSSVNCTLENSKSGVPTRKYRIHLPPNYDNTKAVPLILSFHGRTQDALYQENLSKFSEASYGFQGIAVYPEGVPITKVR
jgi:poly(3-hydroxybutyrate) depolymerase